MAFDDKVVEIPETLPMLPVRDIVVFPYMILPLFVGRETSIRSVEEALAKNRLIFLASQKEITEENASKSDNATTKATVVRQLDSEIATLQAELLSQETPTVQGSQAGPPSAPPPAHGGGGPTGRTIDVRA